jgi:hypothetical protein
MRNIYNFSLLHYLEIIKQAVNRSRNYSIPNNAVRGLQCHKGNHLLSVKEMFRR